MSGKTAVKRAKKDGSVPVVPSIAPKPSTAPVQDKEYATIEEHAALTIVSGKGWRRQRHAAKKEARDARPQYGNKERAWAAVAAFLAPPDVSALAATCVAAHTGVRCLALPREPPHALNARLSLLHRRVAAAAAKYGGVVTASNTFQVRAPMQQRRAYVAAMCSIARAMYEWSDVMPGTLLGAAAADFVGEFWGLHAHRTPHAALDAVFSRLTATGDAALKPVPPRRVLEWLRGWQMTSVAGVEAKHAPPPPPLAAGAKRSRGAKRKVRWCSVLDALWIEACIVGGAIVALRDVRWSSTACWVYNKSFK